MSSLSFPWKRIEERPENASTVRVLIESVEQSKKSSSEELRQPEKLLEKFIDHFKLQDFFQIDFSCSNTKNSKNNRRLSSKEQIILTNEIKNMSSDFEKFSLHKDKTLKRFQFFFETNYYLYILWWGVEVISCLKKREKVPPLVILDITLSLNRLMMKDIITQEKYKLCFEIVNKKYNTLMNPTFYNLLFNNPKLLVESSLQMYNNEICLYKEQKIIIDMIKNAIDKNSPLLLGNQMPTGQGKTFLAVPLGKLVSMEKVKKRKKCVLFACSNELVNMDVASNALVGNDLHLWLAKNLIIDIKDKKGNFLRKEKRVLLRPYKSCFPNEWKKIYKRKEDEKYKNGTIHEQWSYYTNATGKIPDIIVADLDSCLQLLKYQHSLIHDTLDSTGKNTIYPPFDNANPFVAYIDEFISDEISNPKMAEICHYLPRQTVLLSSVLPKFEFIPSIVNDFCLRHETTQEQCCDRVSSTDVSIPCCVIHPDGHICFPHHQIKTRQDLDNLVLQMSINPRIRRTYSSKHVFFWAKDLEEILPKEIQFNTKFASIGSINNKDIIQYVLVLLDYLRNNWNLLDRFKQYRPKVMEPVSKDDLFTKQSWEYEPKTLVVMNNPMKQVVTLTEKLFKNKIKVSKLTDEVEKRRSSLQKKNGADSKKEGFILR
jgi:hypothetical protein